MKFRPFCTSLFFLLFAALPVFAQFGLVDSIEHEGIYRDYLLYVPDIYTGNEAVPLVFNLHGAGSNAGQQAIYSRLDLVADTANFIIVTPNAIINLWNSGFLAPYWSGPDDVGLMSALIDHISSTHNVDLNRVYSTGMSMGGFMSYRLACELDNRIAAIASVTGLMTDSVAFYCEAERRVPIMQIHGTEDGTVPYEGSLAYGGVNETMEFWRNRNECLAAPIETDLPDIAPADETTVSLSVFEDCEANSEVRLYTVHGGGHTWPGAFSLPGDVTSQEIKANVEVWNFLSRFTLADGVVGVETPLSHDRAAIRFYPNPFDHELKIEVENKAIEGIAVYNVLGEIIFEKNFEIESFKNDLFIETTAWRAGVYFVEVTAGEERMVYRVVK